MKKIEKALKNEIKKSARTDFSKISEKCGITGNELKSREVQMALADGSEISNTKRNIAIISILTVLFVTVSLCLIIANLPKPTNKSSKGYFIIDINPSIEICYDENGMVTDVNPLNEDAEILLCSLDFSEKHYTEALTSIVDSCIELGYISADRTDNAVMTTAVGEDGFKDEHMTDVVKKAVCDELSNRKILGVVITGVESPELKEEAEKFGIDAQKYSLIKKFIDAGGEILEEEYGKISIRELYNGIYEKEKEAKEKLINELKEKEDKSKADSINAIKLKAEEIIAHLNLSLEYIPELEQVGVYEIILQIEALLDGLEGLETVEDVSGVLEQLKTLVSVFDHSIQFDFDALDGAIDEFVSSNESFHEASKTPEEKREEMLNKSEDKKQDSQEDNIEESQEKHEGHHSSSKQEEQTKDNGMTSPPNHSKP